MARATEGEAHGYSGKPLAKKLGVKPEMNAIAIGAPDSYAALVEAAVPVASKLPASGTYDFLHLFVRDTADLQDRLPDFALRMAPGGMLWISWPKKSSPLHRDLTEDGIRSLALPMGLVDIKVCAVDADWSGLKLVRRKVS
jgi:hypothetical protein